MVTVKKLNSGNFGVFIGTNLVSVAKTERRAKVAQTVIDEELGNAYADGHCEGYGEGESDGRMDRE